VLLGRVLAVRRLLHEHLAPIRQVHIAVRPGVPTPITLMTGAGEFVLREAEADGDALSPCEVDEPASCSSCCHPWRGH
jgi:hypothetical protein